MALTWTPNTKLVPFPRYDLRGYHNAPAIHSPARVALLARVVLIPKSIQTKVLKDPFYTPENSHFCPRRAAHPELVLRSHLSSLHVTLSCACPLLLEDKDYI